MSKQGIARTLDTGTVQFSVDDLEGSLADALYAAGATRTFRLFNVANVASAERIAADYGVQISSGLTWPSWD